MQLGLLDAINKLITERGSAAVLEKHVAFIREQATALERRIADLEQENRELKKLAMELQSSLESSQRDEEFVEHRGALFKRKPDGTFHDAVYCPACSSPMTSLQGILPYHCKCGQGVDFTGNELKKVREDLPK